MSAQDYYNDGDRPHERHHDAPPQRDNYEPSERRDGDRPDFYSHEGSRDGSRREGSGEHDRGLVGTLAGGAAGAFGGHALGNKAGHGVAGTILGAVAGAFAGHETEEKVDEWKEEKKEKKEEKRWEEEERRHHEQEEHRRHDEPSHYGGGRREEPRHEQPRGDSVQVTVQQGDTLRTIAARFEGVSFEDIVRHNNIQNPDLIYPGQVLEVPARRGGW